MLRHLPQTAGLELLDVAIGDGVYLPWMPADWQVVGVDISLVAAPGLPRARRPGRGPADPGRGRGAAVPDRQFDAVLSIGAFNYFNDPEGALREMVRVARPGGADRHLRRDAQLDRPDARPQTGAARRSTAGSSRG